MPNRPTKAPPIEGKLRMGADTVNPAGQWTRFLIGIQTDKEKRMHPPVDELRGHYELDRDEAIQLRDFLDKALAAKDIPQPKTYNFDFGPDDGNSSKAG